MGSHDSPKDQAIIDFIHKTNAENNGLFFTVRRRIADGWGITRYPSPEQISAALLMEATDQDRYVTLGQSAPEFPVLLRKIAFELLALAGHKPPSPPDLSQELAQWQEFASYCRCCAVSGEHDPQTFDDFVRYTTKQEPAA